MSKLTKVTFRLLDLIVIFAMIFGSPMSALAAGGSYTINFAAADPADYIPPVPYPESVTPIVGRGNGDSEIPAAWFTRPGGADTKVESLTPDDMALGQVVPFEIRITVTGATTPEDGVITFVAGWNIDTSSNDLFGYDPSYGVIAAFIDTGDGSFIDPGGDATVSNYTWAVVGDEIQGTFTVSGLDQGDMVVLEAWLVLDETIPAKATGNVPSRLISAQTAAGDAISTGNQTVPLLQVGDFFNADVDISVTKTDSPDPVMKGDQLTYTLAVNNAGPNIANGVKVTDTLDPNTSFVSATVSDPMATCSQAAGVVTCDLGAVVPSVPVTITITVLVAETAPTAGTTGTGTCTVGGVGVDLCNSVAVSTISNDTNTANNSDSEPTDIPAFIPNPVINVEKSSTTASITAANQVVPYTFVVTNTGNVPLSGVAVTDAKCDAAPLLQSGDTNSDSKLDLTEIWTYTCSHTVTQAEMDAGGNLSNTVTADSNESEPDNDSLDIPLNRTAAINVEKSSTTTSITAAGQVVPYTFVVTNADHVTLTGITVTDPMCDAAALLVSGDDNGDSKLQVSETWTYTCDHTVTQTEIDAGGNLSNTVTADSNESEPDTDSLDIPIDQNAAMTVEKSSETTSLSAPGTVTYDYLVTNTGNVTLTGIALSDNNDNDDLVCETDTLAVGASMSCTATHTFTQAELDAGGSLDNIVTASSNEAPDATDSLSIPISKTAAIIVVKASTAVEVVEAGQVIPYTFTVDNNGNVTLTGITVNDPMCDADPVFVSGDANKDGNLQVDETWTYTCNHTVTQEEVDAGGDLINTVTADSNESEPDEDTLEIPVIQSPALTVVKTASPQTYNSVGDEISYSYLVTNSGNVTLYNISVVDDKATVTCPAGATSLIPGASVTCTASYTITQADLDAGSVTNTAYATDGTTQSEPDSETVNAVPNPALTIDKTATESTYAAVGDVIHYSYEVTNSGNVTLYDITVSDDKATVTCPDTSAGLAPTKTVTCTASYIIQQSDLDAGSLTNSAYAKSGDTQSPPDEVTVPATQSPAIDLTKTVSSTGPYDSVSDLIEYKLVATNTGNVTLTNVSISDPLLGTLTCTPVQPATLAPKETLTCTGSYAVKQSDLDAGKVDNTATATGSFGGKDYTDTDSQSVPMTQSAAIIVVKASTTAQVVEAGQVVPYTFDVSNGGNVTLTVITVSDPKCDEAPAYDSGDTNSDGKLQVGEIWVYTCDHAVTQPEVDAGGNLTNTVTADSQESEPATDTLNIPVTQSPAVSIDKTAAPATYDAVNDVITYSYLVTNEGNITLYGITVVDDKATVTCPDTSAGLAPLVQITCTASYTISQTDLDAGGITNTAYATDGTTESEPDSETVTAVPMPALTIDKTATPATYDAVDNVISYSYLVTNSGNITLYDISVVDNKASVTCPDTSAGLAPQGTIICSASYTITQADLDAGSVTNTAYATDGTTQSDPDSVTVIADQNPVISLIKTVTSTGPYDLVGDVITYELVATNSGNVTLTNVSISDPLLGTLTCTQPVTLAPAGTLTCTGSYLVQQGDLDAGKVDNTATATGSFGGNDYTDTASQSVPMTQSPAISLIKSASPTTYDAVNQTITYSYVIQNTGNVTLAGPFTISDDKASVTCTQPADGKLSPTETMNCTATYKIAQADLDAGAVTNKATASGGGVTSNEATATVTADQKPALTLDKTATPTTYSTVGATIGYSYKLTNGGNVTLSGPFTLADNKATVTCPATSSLAPGAYITCSATYTITQADLDAGSVTNTAKGKGSFNDNDVFSNEDSETVTAVQNPAITLTKTASPTLYDEAGDVITYTLVAKNSGNVTLHDVSITDPKLGQLTCNPSQPATMAPNATLTCTGTYTIQASDLTVFSVTNTATVNGKGPQDQLVSATATATVYRQTGALLPTETTCQMYAGGPSMWPTMYDAFTYQVKSGKISAVSPGVIFYYNTIQAPSSSFTLSVTQINTLNWKPLLIQDLGQAILYNANCNKASGVRVTTTANPYTVKFTVTGAIPGATYYIGIKYSPKNLLGQKVTAVDGVYPTSIYSFATTGYIGSAASIPVKPK